MRRIRSARAIDADAIADVVATAFAGPYHARSLQSVRDGPDRWRVLEEDGRIVSACRLLIYRVRVGRAEIHEGDLGMVCTHPDFQGRGLASALMRDTISHMRERQCQFGRLGGYVPFYSRFGWVPFPRRYVEFPVEPAKAGASTLQPGEYLKSARDFGARIVPFDPVEHHEARARLYDTFNHNRTGSLVIAWGEPPKPGAAQPDATGLRFVCDIGGEVAGYAFAFEREADHTAFEAKVQLGEFAYDIARPEALGALVSHLLCEAHARGAQRVTGRLPLDAEIERAMREAAIPFNWVELHSAPASNMITIVDPVELLRRIVPELEARLAASPIANWSGELAFCLPDGRAVVLEIDRGSVAAWELAPRQNLVHLDQATLLTLVLGLKGFRECAEVQSEDNAETTTEVCRALFPRQPTASGVWG
jgi:predicted N-acetyltransferase YhbS